MQYKIALLPQLLTVNGSFVFLFTGPALADYETASDSSFYQDFCKPIPGFIGYTKTDTDAFQFPGKEIVAALSLSLSLSLCLSVCLSHSLCVCECVCACVRACVRACMRVRACPLFVLKQNLCFFIASQDHSRSVIASG